MHSNPLVTVYVPCHNYGKYLTQCVDSVFAQLYPHWELIIVDDASRDETHAIAERLRERAPDRIKVLRNEAPTGLQKVANRVLGLAAGKYIMRLDADDWLDEGALLLMVAKLEAEPNCGMVYGNYYYTDPDGRVLGSERRQKLGVEDTAGHLPPHGACTMVRTRALKAAGGYSEDINAQDGWELWFKLFNRVGAASLDAPLFYYRQHQTSLSRDANRLLQARSKIFTRVGNALESSYNPSCLAVIGVRESYPGFEGVPYRVFEGITLLERAILSAAKASKVTRVLVSSGSQRVLDFAARLEREGRVPLHERLLRAEAAVPGTVPMREIMMHACEHEHQVHGRYPDVVAFLSLHAVRRSHAHVDDALNMLRITQSDSVVSVQEEREPIFGHGTEGLSLLNPGRLQDLAYDRERLYRFNGAMLAVWYETLATDSLLGRKVAYVEMSASDSLQIKGDSPLASLHASLASESAAPTRSGSLL